MVGYGSVLHRQAVRQPRWIAGGFSVRSIQEAVISTRVALFGHVHADNPASQP